MGSNFKAVVLATTEITDQGVTIKSVSIVSSKAIGHASVRSRVVSGRTLTRRLTRLTNGKSSIELSVVE